ncbi:4261_t:CDS:10 [Ambispora leptoticha]|uniref:4261_t:CDS:1 n=1 Tax=Ambispora leptoticha TaxID=144679 RepID=A0A9N9A6Y6_9GLOM|nr:4261_t:CDS:10 [Ambispora leptoticha]
MSNSKRVQKRAAKDTDSQKSTTTTTSKSTSSPNGSNNKDAAAITSNDVTVQKTSSSSNSLGAGAYIGIGLGILVAIGLAGFFLRKKINRRKDSEDKEWNRNPDESQTRSLDFSKTPAYNDVSGLNSSAYSKQAPQYASDSSNYTPQMTQTKNVNSSTKDDTSNYNVASSGGATWDYLYGTNESDKEKSADVSNEKPTQSTFSKQWLTDLPLLNQHNSITSNSRFSDLSSNNNSRPISPISNNSGARLLSPKKTDSDTFSYYNENRESLQNVLQSDDAFSSVPLDDKPPTSSSSQSSQTKSKKDKRISSPLLPTFSSLSSQFESKKSKRISSPLRPTSSLSPKDDKKLFLRLSKDLEKEKPDRSSFVEHMEMMLQNFGASKTTLNMPEFAQKRPDSHPLEGLEDILAQFTPTDQSSKATTQQTNNSSGAVNTTPQTPNPTHNRNSRLIRNTPSPSPINIPEARIFIKKDEAPLDPIPQSNPSSPPVVKSSGISTPPSVLSLSPKDKTASQESKSSPLKPISTLPSIENTILKKSLTEEPSTISDAQDKKEPKNTESKSPVSNNLNKTLSSSSEKNLTVNLKPTESVSPPISPTFIGKKPKKAVGIVNDRVKKFENEAKSAAKTPVPIKRSSIQMSPFIKEATSISAKRSSTQMNQPGKEPTPIPIKRSSIQIPATFSKDVNSKPLGDSPLRGSVSSKTSSRPASPISPIKQNATKIEEIKANLTGVKKSEEKNEQESLPSISVTPSNRESVAPITVKNLPNNNNDKEPDSARDSESELSNIQVAVKVNVARKQVASFSAVKDSNQDSENNFSAPSTPKFGVSNDKNQDNFSAPSTPKFDAAAEMSDDNDSIYVDPESNTSSARSSLSSGKSATTLVANTNSAPKDSAPETYRSSTLSLFDLYGSSEDNYRKSQQSGFKKTLNRTGTTIMQRTGAIEKTVDREFDEEERRIKNLQQKSEKLHKEAKGYLDSVRAMTAAQIRIAETIDNFYEDSDNALVGAKYKKAVEKLDTECRNFMDEPYRQTVLDPLGRFCAYFPDINESIKRRHKKLLDYDAMRSKVRKLVEKPSDDPTKLPRVEQQAETARETYESLNSKLLEELPQLIDLRVDYIDPTFEAFVKIQLKFCQESYEQLDALQQYFPEDRHHDGQIEEVLQQMRDLAICGMG